MKVFPTMPGKDIFLKSLCQFAIQNGADSANIIEVKDIEFTDMPLDCPHDERSFYYPQVIYKNDPIKDILKTYQFAVVFTIDKQQDLKKVYEVTSKVEAHCFYNNYHLAVGLAAGNCRKVFCSSKDNCQAMTQGKGCAFPMMARPSIEACNIDFDTLTYQSNISHYNKNEHFLGMVFVN